MSQTNQQRGNQKGGNDNRNTVPGSSTQGASQDQKHNGDKQQAQVNGGLSSLQSGRTTAQGQHTASGDDGNHRRVTNDTSMNKGQQGTNNESSQAQGVGEQNYDSGKQTHR